MLDYLPKLGLASRSPRRQELLRQLGVEFGLVDVNIDESVLPGESALPYVERMAKQKALTAWQEQAYKTKAYPLLLTADTSVVLNDRVLGKPEDLGDAQKMLGSLSGKTHQVITCVAVIHQQGIDWRSSVTQVKFAPLSQQLIKDYCATREGLDKAGGYAIQGKAALFVEHISGSYSGVVGLPLFETGQLLNEYHSKSLSFSANRQ